MIFPILTSNKRNQPFYFIYLFFLHRSSHLFGLEFHVRLSQSRVTLPNFQVLDVKTQNIWLTVNLNAYLHLQRLYRHFAYHLELSFRPWKWFVS